MQRRNQRIVYDAIGTLADAVGAELNQVTYGFTLSSPFLLMNLYLRNLFRVQ